jgi:hypothetical protein
MLVLPSYFQNPIEFDKVVDNFFQQLTEKKQDDKKILCGYCKNPITSYQHKIEIAGKHQHYLTNPSNIIFSVGCFAQAQGCIASGQPTLEYTWFYNYYWSYALCQSCQTHLGWRYHNGQHHFYGLILAALVDE